MTAEFGDLANLDPDKVLREMRQWGDNAERLKEKMAEIEGTAQSGDGYVSVVFSTDGLRELEINPRAMRMASADLAESIRNTIVEATADMQQKMQAAMAGAFGDRNPMEMIKDPDSVVNQARESQQMLNRTVQDGMSALEYLRKQMDL